MPKILTKDDVNGVTETFEMEDDTVGVRHTQDVQPFLDHVARVNSAGGAREVPGLGVMAYEVPVALAVKWANELGVPWEVLAYSKEYEDTWLRLCKAHPRLAYNPAKKLY